jgi:hypothetical protein
MGTLALVNELPLFVAQKCGAIAHDRLGAVRALAVTRQRRKRRACLLDSGVHAQVWWA